MMLDQHRDVRRHWCPLSERYTGCDTVLSMMNAGWRLLKTASVKYYLQRNKRVTRVYTFLMAQGAIIRTIHVIETPTVRQIVERHDLHVFDRQDTPFAMDEDEVAVSDEPIKREMVHA